MVAFVGVCVVVGWDREPSAADVVGFGSHVDGGGWCSVRVLMVELFGAMKGVADGIPQWMY